MVTIQEKRVGSRPRMIAARGGVRAVVLGAAVAACLAGWNAALDSAAAQTDVACPLSPSLDAPSAMPPDVCERGELPDGNFYALSWQVFKFLVWPRKPGERGIPDTARSITSMEGPRTFETLKADWEVFLPNGVRPVDWGDYPDAAVAPCKNRPDIPRGALVLASFSEFGNLVTGERGDRHVLVAQNRTYVRYQIAYNEMVFNGIRKGGLHNEQKVRGLPNAPAGTDVSEDARQDDGALTVKTAWIELPAQTAPPATHIDRSRFYVRDDAWVQNPQTRECHMAAVGLVGLHAVYKTKSRPQWIWSTFEHVDNAPPLNDNSGRSYTFFDGRGTPMKDKPDEEFLFPREDGTLGPAEPASAYQVQRLQKIDPRVVAANLAWQEKLRSLGSVWQNYMLVVTQWPRVSSAPKLDAGDPELEDNASPTPRCARKGGRATANTTMETFLQGEEQGCGWELTCMGCHNASRKTDFIWSIKLNKNVSPTAAGPSSRDTGLKKLEDILQNKLRR